MSDRPPLMKISWPMVMALFVAELAAGALLIAAAIYLFMPRGGGPIREVMDRQAAAWNRGDLEGFMDGYWNSDELMFCSGSSVTNGWQGTLDRYRKRYQTDGGEMGQLGFSDITITNLSNDSGVVSGRWRLTKKNSSPNGLLMLMFRKINGEWKITHDVTTSEKP